MMERSTSVLSVYTTNGRHDYFGKNADEVYNEIDRAIAYGSKWTSPIFIETKNGDGTVRFQMENVTTFAYMEGDDSE